MGKSNFTPNKCFYEVAGLKETGSATELRFKKRNVSVLFVQSAIDGLGNNMFQIVWQPFVLTLNPSMAFLGGISSISSLSMNLMQPVAGKMADVSGRKRYLILASILLSFALLLYAMATSWVFLIPGVILMGLSMAFSNPAWTALTAESVEREVRGTTFGVLTAPSVLMGIIAPALTWLLVGWKGLRIIFWTYFAATITNLILITLFLEETLDVSIQIEKHRQLDVRKIFKELLKPEKGLRGFYFAVTLDAFAWGLGMEILYGMLYAQYGFTIKQLAVLSAAFSASMGLSQVPIGKLVDRHGRKPYLIISELIGIIVISGFILTTNFTIFIILQVLMGLCAATWVPAVLAYISDHVEDIRRAEAIGKYSAFRGLISFPAPTIGGILYDLFGGMLVPLLINLILVFLCIVLISKLVYED